MIKIAHLERKKRGTPFMLLFDAKPTRAHYEVRTANGKEVVYSFGSSNLLSKKEIEEHLKEVGLIVVGWLNEYEKD